jgi:hypothetical protein
MARGYVLVRADETADVHLVVQGRLTSWAPGERHAPRVWGVTGAAPGVYRVALHLEEDRWQGDLGARVDPTREAARLDRLLLKTTRSAYSTKCGVQGYQQRADASAVAQEAAREATRVLGNFLRKLATTPATEETRP